MNRGYDEEFAIDDESGIDGELVFVEFELGDH